MLHAHRELKQATVLLADLCDSTTRVVRTDAEGGQAFLDRGFGELHEHGGFLVTDPLHLAHRYLHLFAGEPVAGFDDQLMDGPTFVVH